MKYLPPDAPKGQIIDAVNRIVAHLEGRQPPDIIDVVMDLPRHEEKAYATRPLDTIDQIVVHHVGDPTGADVSPEQTAAYHVRKGWPGIAYHYYVRKNGTIYQTQYFETVSYHCVGECNWCSIGICLEGSFIRGRVPTGPQLRSLESLLWWLAWEFDAGVFGHKEVRDDTVCPGDWWDSWKAFHL